MILIKLEITKNSKISIELVFEELYAFYLRLISSFRLVFEDWFVVAKTLLNIHKAFKEVDKMHIENSF